jgi:hypothetical protein
VETDESMITPVFKPLGISAVSASLLVTIESVFLGSLPTLALVVTFVGPFVPLIGGAWSRGRVVSAEDARDMYEPLFEELEKNKEAILSSDKWGQIPSFQKDKLDQIRKSARYSLLKSGTPAVEELCKSMDSIFAGQGDANRSAGRIIGEMAGSVLAAGADGVSFHGPTKEGSVANFDSSWTCPLLITGRDPLSHYRKQEVDINSMGITDKSNNVKGSLTFPIDEERYRKFWDSVERKAKKDPQITRMRDLLSGLPNLVNSAEAEVLDKIKKSRSIFGLS